jgi:hypothetical protein
MMATNPVFLPSVGLVAITRGVSCTPGALVWGDVLKVIAAFRGLVFVALLLLAAAALSTGFF